jgi:hypothetical protein
MRKAKPRVELDSTPYSHAPTITVSTGVSLCRALVAACPKDAPAHVKKASKHLAETAEEAAGELAARNRALGVSSEEDTRALDNLADRAWGGLRLRLQGLAMLDPETHPRAKQAAALEARLFPGGTGFLAAVYAEQSTAMATVLRLIDEDGLQKSVDSLAGPEFLAALREVQPRYEKMVEERLRRDTASGQNLGETVRALQAAIVHYAQKVVGLVEHDDPASLEVVRKALRPIDAHREASGRAGGAAGEPEAPPPAPTPA